MTFTYQDLVRENVLSARLLAARKRFAGRAPQPHLLTLRQIIDRLGGAATIGDEPGAAAFTRQSAFCLLRTSATSSYRATIQTLEDGGELVYPFAYSDQALRWGDVFVAKDGPVGNSALFAWDDAPRPMGSSGLVRLTLPGKTLFYFGLIHFGPFASDIDLLTPGGATYRHAGLPLILSARLPAPDHRPELQARVAALTGSSPSTWCNSASLASTVISSP